MKELVAESTCGQAGDRPRSLLLPLLLLGCHSTPEDAEVRLEAAVHDAVEGDVHHAVLAVDAPRLGVSGTWAAGVANAKTGAPMTPETPFLSASVGKLFVAATTVSLATRGALSLEDPVTRWVNRDALLGLPVGGGDAALDQITVAMLLGHRSGLPDYFHDPDVPPFDGAPDVLALILAEPDRTWTRADLLAHTRAHFRSDRAPGASFRYADTNYDLLGMVLEGVTGALWTAAVRTEVLTPLGMTHTWAHHLEPHPLGVGAIADTWVGEVNVGGYASLSADQAAGGYATTAGDLLLLLRGLERGAPVGLDALGVYTEDALGDGLDYGYGLWRIRPGGIFFLMRGMPTLHGVSGSTGSFAYLTVDGAAAAGTFDQTEEREGHVRFLLSKVLPTLGSVTP